MHPAYTKRCAVAIPAGLALLAPLLHALLTDAAGAAHRHPVAVSLAVPGILLYLWGCALLAKAKGYSREIRFTAVLGLIFPLVLLLTLEDRR
jgi:hypothetical protein